MKKSPPQKEKAALIALWIPQDMKLILDQAVQVFDSDRSKYIRNALREKLNRELRIKTTA